MSLTTFVSQNLGAKQYDRAKKGAYFGIICSITLAELVGITIYLASPVLISLFNREADVVAFGVMQAHTVTLFYFLLAFSHCIAGILRGAGLMKQFMITTFTDLVLRVVLAFVLSGIFGSTGIWMAWPVGWSIATTMSIMFYRKSFSQRK